MEKISDLRVGMVVLRSISLVNTPPSVSMPSDSGVTSSNSTSLTSPLSTPAWMAAPTATTSSGLTPWCGVLLTSVCAVSTTLRHAGHAADQHQFVNLLGCDAGVLQTALHRRDGALEQVVAELLHLGARQLQADDAWARWRRR